MLKKFGSFHSHPYNKEKVKKIKANNSSYIFQRTEVIGQTPALRIWDSEANTENHSALGAENQEQEPIWIKNN